MTPFTCCSKSLLHFVQFIYSPQIWNPWNAVVCWKLNHLSNHLPFNRNMGGQIPPNNWKGALNVSYRVGPGFTHDFQSQWVLQQFISPVTVRTVEFFPPLWSPLHPLRCSYSAVFWAFDLSPPPLLLLFSGWALMARWPAASWGTMKVFVPPVSKPHTFTGWQK